MNKIPVSARISSQLYSDLEVLKEASGLTTSDVVADAIELLTTAADLGRGVDTLELGTFGLLRFMLWGGYRSPEDMPLKPYEVQHPSGQRFYEVAACEEEAIAQTNGPAGSTAKLSF